MQMSSCNNNIGRRIEVEHLTSLYPEIINNFTFPIISLKIPKCLASELKSNWPQTLPHCRPSYNRTGRSEQHNISYQISVRAIIELALIVNNHTISYIHT